MVSETDRTKRALVSLLKTLAGIYAVTLNVTRESSDKDVSSAYRKLSRKTHPDRGFVYSTGRGFVYSGTCAKLNGSSFGCTSLRARFRRRGICGSLLKGLALLPLLTSTAV